MYKIYQRWFRIKMPKIKSKISSLSRPKKAGFFCCSFCCIFMIAIIVSGMIIASLAQREIVSDIDTINPSGTTGRAFVVYRPGLSSFQKDVTYAFVEGLEENDWIVDITTASAQTPTDLSSHDLLVLGTVTYGGQPHQSVVDYIERLGDLKGKKVVIIVTAAQGDEVPSILREKVEKANGKVIETLIFFTMSDNGGEPTVISREAGRNVQA